MWSVVHCCFNSYPRSCILGRFLYSAHSRSWCCFLSSMVAVTWSYCSGLLEVVNGFWLGRSAYSSPKEEAIVSVSFFEPVKETTSFRRYSFYVPYQYDVFYFSIWSTCSARWNSIVFDRIQRCFCRTYYLTSSSNIRSWNTPAT